MKKKKENMFGGWKMNFDKLKFTKKQKEWICILLFNLAPYGIEEDDEMLESIHKKMRDSYTKSEGKR